MVAAAFSYTNDRSPRSGLDSRDVEDATLAKAVAAGDGAALDQLYLLYRPTAFAAAYAVLRDPCAAEDAVQDAFMRAWRSASSYQAARGSLRSWLLTIVRNTAVDQLRARGIAIRYQPRLVQQSVETEDLATSIATAADARRLRAALGDLPPEQRHALELAFFGGLTHGEIAARTGTPLGTVKGRVRLGLRRLRQDLADMAPTAMTSQLPAYAA